MAKTNTLRLLQRAVDKSNGGDHQAALAELDVIVAMKAEEPFGSDALYHRARAKHALGDRAGALKDFTASLAIRPTEPEVLNGRAMLYLERGDLKRAKADLQTALADDVLGTVAPEYAIIYCSLAEVLAAEGNIEGALFALERAIHLDAEWRREAPKLETLGPLRKDPRWKPIIAGKHVLWLDQRPLLRLHYHRAKLDTKRRVPEKLGSHVIPVPIRQLLRFTWPGIKGGFQFGYANAPTRSELAHIPDPKRPWVIWARGSGAELVLLALDDRTPSNPEVHVVRATPKRVFRSKKRLDLWLAALR